MKKNNANPVLTMRPDPALVALAKDRGINLREVLEKALRKELAVKTCSKCGRDL